jgi:hypothetical protein
VATASLVGVGFTIHLAAVSTGWLRLMLIAVAGVTIAAS